MKNKLIEHEVNPKVRGSNANFLTFGYFVESIDLEDVQLSEAELKLIESASFEDALEEDTHVTDLYSGLKAIARNGKTIKISFLDSEYYVIDPFTAKKLLAHGNRTAINNAAKSKYHWLDFVTDALLGWKD